MRTFGFELEGSGVPRDTLAQALRDAGIYAESQGYNHQTQGFWKVTTDASVNGTYPFELVSPILTDTAETWQAVKTVLRVIKRLGGQVNASCGFHVHVGVSDLSVDQFRNVVKKWVKYEDLIDEFMPVGRRRNANTYCQSIIGQAASYACTESDTYKGGQKALFERLDRCTTIRAMFELTPSRYTKLNMSAYVRYGTIEFRQHSGTFDFEKVQNWVRFLLKFIDGAIKHQKINPRFKEAPRAHRLNTLLRGLHDGKLSRYYRRRLAQLNGGA